MVQAIALLDLARRRHAWRFRPPRRKPSRRGLQLQLVGFRRNEQRGALLLPLRLWRERRHIAGLPLRRSVEAARGIRGRYDSSARRATLSDVASTSTLC